MKELKVGERITITLEAVEQFNCKDCFFEGSGRCTDIPCRDYQRSDRKVIALKEVKE